MRHFSVVGTNMVRLTLKCALTALSICFATTVIATDVSPEIQARLSEKLQILLPDSKVTSVVATPIKDLYEVMVGASITYMSADGRYAFNGSLIDIDNLKNLTGDRRQAARAAMLAGLGNQDYIEYRPKGKINRTLYVFTDIDCGYCRKLHKEVPALTDAGIAVRYLAFPRSGIGGESFDKLVSVWCSKDRNEALTVSKLGKKVSAEKCDNPVAAQYKIGEDFGIRGTPAMYLDDGEQIGGYRSAKDVISEYLPADS